MTFSVTIVFCALVAIASAADQDFQFRICKQNDPKYQACLDDAIGHAIKSFAKGHRGMKVVPLEPMAVDSISISETGDRSVSLKQEYKNIKLYGLTKDLQIFNSRVDWNKKKITMDAFNPQVEFLADYKLDGKVLLLPITGTGKSNITMYDLKTKNSLSFDMIDKNGETYLKIKNFDIKFNPDHVLMSFTNLFNGDPVLGENMNKFLNENSDLLFTELKPEYQKSFGIVFNKISQDLFLRFPAKKFFSN